MENSSGSRVTCLILRIITFVFLFISFFILVTTSKTVMGVRLHFNQFHAYRYVLATIIIGIILNLLQIAFSLFNTVKNGSGTILFDFFGDKFLSYLLATGMAAGFGLTVDLQTTDADDEYGEFFDKAYAASALLLFAFFCAAAVSILSSFALSNRA
ncbi:CASP-like protein 4D1 [Momordica charantia]|uniref:CASP-like protein n=1 Tax=Momordica charantia TaxID=3673 RepID=A0A6J1C1S4_MOMCH|nr:CASP-like protein 4D1 [Momordica charantia]